MNIPAPPIKSDSSYIDTNKAVIQYDTVPGTPQHYVDSINTNSKSAGAYDNVAGDSTNNLNARLGYPYGNSKSTGALRVRNPTWCSELRIYMPTTFYSNPTLKYTLQSSSTNSGQHWQVFAYSVDSGHSWKSTGITVNGVATDSLDCTQSQYQQSSSPYAYGLVTIGFAGDTAVNNNPKLVFRIRWGQIRGQSGSDTLFSGNNRFENMSVEAGPVPQSIAISHPGSDTLYSGQKDTILYTITGKVSRLKTYYYSLDSGITWTKIAQDTGIVVTGGFGFAWTVPTVYDPNARVIISAVDSARVTGYSASFIVMPLHLLPPPANLIHYWHFNYLQGGPYTYTAIPQLPSDYSAVNPGKAGISFQLDPGTPVYNYSGRISGVIGTGIGEQMNYPAGQAIEIANPSDQSQMLFYIPTTNHENIQIHYLLQTAGNNSGPVVEMFDYSIDSGLTWRTTALKQTSDTINVPPYVNGWGAVNVDLSSDLLASDNPKLVFRLRFAGNNSSGPGYVKIDNFSVTGPVGQVTIPGAPTLVHYWNFNKITTAYHVPNVPNINADYSLIDTNTAYFQYYLVPGTSNSYLGYIDNVASADTSNLRNGAVAGNALRIRNPVDSIELRWYIPTTGYHSPTVKFVVESSSTTSGDSTQIYSYSVDGGTTWKSAGMSVNGVPNVDTLDVTQPQYQGSSWGLVTVGFGSDAAVNNNPNLIFRITYRGNTHLTSGNNRYDDFTVDALPGAGTAPVSPLIHYWHFDALAAAGVYHNPNIPAIPADYSVITPNPAKILYLLEPGTSPTYAGYIDTVGGDTTNSQLGNGAGKAMRVRNPSDSMELHFVIPSTGYKNITVNYGLESSSINSGQLVEHFDYSVDGGTTWKSSALTVNGGNVDTLDVTQSQYQGVSWGLVTIGFGNDTTVNNNANLVLRLKFTGNTSKTSGNNRIENVTVDGTSLIGPPPPPLGPGKITVTLDGHSTPTPIDTVFAGTKHTIAYTISGGVTPTRTIEYSIDGSYWAVIASNVSALSYNWTIPVLGSNHALIRVVDGAHVIGTSQPFVMLDSGRINNVWIQGGNVRTGQSSEIVWSASGYLGNMVTISVSLNGGSTWDTIVSNFAFGSAFSYPWTAPNMVDSNAIARVSFSTGLVGYSKPFFILAPSASVGGAMESSDVHVWPNPIHSSATIEYTLPESGNVTLTLHDVTGREVESIEEGPQPAGDHQISFDGSREANGVYMYELTSGPAVYRGRIVIVH